MPKRALILAMLFLAAATITPRAGAGGAGYFSHLANLRLELEAYVERLQPVLEKEGIESVRLGSFTGSGGLAGQRGDVIALFLREELRRKGIAVSPAAALTIQGEFAPHEDKEAGLTGVVIACSLSDQQGEWAPGKLAARLAHGNTVLACLSGASIDYPRAGSLEAINSAIVRSITTPAARVRGGVVQPESGSQYAIELLRQDDKAWKELMVVAERGVPTGKLRPGEPFAVRLHNHSSDAAAVTLAINGINTFTFADERDPKTGHPTLGFVLVPPRATVLVTGWHRRLRHEDAFKAGNYPDVEDARLLEPGAGMQVSAFFSAAWRDAGEAPKDDPSVSARCGGSIVAPVLVVSSQPERDARQPLLGLTAWSAAIGDWSGPVNVMARLRIERHREKSLERLANHASVLGLLSGADGGLGVASATSPLLRLVDESKAFVALRNVGWTRTVISVRVSLDK